MRSLSENGGKNCDEGPLIRVSRVDKTLDKRREGREVNGALDGIFLPPPYRSSLPTFDRVYTVAATCESL